MKALKEILEIFLKYQTGLVYAEHDIIYFSAPEPSQITKEDLEKLESLGCHYDESIPSWYINC